MQTPMPSRAVANDMETLPHPTKFHYQMPLGVQLSVQELFFCPVKTQHRVQIAIMELLKQRYVLAKPKRPLAAHAQLPAELRAELLPA